VILPHASATTSSGYTRTTAPGRCRASVARTGRRRGLGGCGPVYQRSTPSPRRIPDVRRHGRDCQRLVVCRGPSRRADVGFAKGREVFGTPPTALSAPSTQSAGCLGRRQPPRPARPTQRAAPGCGEPAPRCKLRPPPPKRATRIRRDSDPRRVLAQREPAPPPPSPRR
jgi:hypothetical protein